MCRGRITGPELKIREVILSPTIKLVQDSLWAFVLFKHKTGAMKYTISKVISNVEGMESQSLRRNFSSDSLYDIRILNYFLSINLK